MRFQKTVSSWGRMERIIGFPRPVFTIGTKDGGRNYLCQN